MRGPGEKQLEEDRRLVGQRIQRPEGPSSAKVQARKEREVAGRGEEHDRLARRLHQRRQEHADERAHRRRRPTPRTSSSPRSTPAPAAGSSRTGAACCSPTRSASSATCRTTWSRRSRPRSKRPGRPTCCCTSSTPRAPRPRSRSRPVKAVLEELGLRRQADAPGPEQGRPRPRPLVPRRPEGPPRRLGRHQRGQGRGARPARAGRPRGPARAGASTPRSRRGSRTASSCPTSPSTPRSTAVPTTTDRVLLQCRLPRRCLDFLNEHGAEVRANGHRIYA